MLDELERLAREANAENDDSSDWFCADLIELNELISSSRKARRYIAAANPATVLKLIAVARAAQAFDATRGDVFWSDRVTNARLALRDSLIALKEPT